MTYAQLAAALEFVLADAGVERAARLAKDYFADAHIRPPDAKPADVADLQRIVRVESDADRLIAGEPLPYVTGVAHFFGHALSVGPAVLVPRPETEELVRWVLEREPADRLFFADLCTGSGCIAAALAYARESWRGLAVDVSDDAVDCARRNVRDLGVGDYVRVERHDVLHEQDYLGAGGQWDLLVSNPPYVPDEDWLRVAPEVAAYEPHLALRVSDDDPLIFYRRLTDLAARHLLPGGRLYVECNDRYVDEVAALFGERGLSRVEVLVDMQGRPRHVRGVAGSA